MFKERRFEAKIDFEITSTKWGFHFIYLNCLKNQWGMEVARCPTYRGIIYEGQSNWLILNGTREIWLLLEGWSMVEGHPKQ